MPHSFLVCISVAFCSIGCTGKDLSHVPCRFFKAGACTAGASCPFSHATSEPGQPKGICQWYVKGNCKFGHKCALAHVLPGQPMNMDRKNKRAEQQAAKAGATAAAAGSGGSAPSAPKDRESNDSKRAPHHEKTESTSSSSGKPSGTTAASNGTTSSSTPLRPSSLSISSRPPMLIGKAAPSVSAVASENALHHDSNFAPTENKPIRASGITTSFAAVAAGSSGLSALRSTSRANNGAGAGSTSGSSPSNGPPITMSSNDRDSPPLTTSTPATTAVEASPASLSEPAKADAPPSGPTAQTPSQLPQASDQVPHIPLPESRPVHHHRPTHSSDLGFGPIGSPPATSRLAGGISPAMSPPSGGIAAARARMSNGMSPSPRVGAGGGLEDDVPQALSSSIQGNSSLFVSHGPGGSVPARSQFASAAETQAGLGLGRPTIRSRESGGGNKPSVWAGSLPARAFLDGAAGESAIADDDEDGAGDDFEDWVPSSLNELLTLDERTRRMSRSGLGGAGRPKFDPDSEVVGSPRHTSHLLQQPRTPQLHSPQPKFVSSVPTASILNNFRGIWDEPGASNDPAIQRNNFNTGTEAWARGGGPSGAVSAGLPGSFGLSGVDVPSPSLLGTSNASAAFLSGRGGGALPRDDMSMNMPGVSSSYDRFNAPSNLAQSPPQFNGGLRGHPSQGANLGGFGLPSGTGPISTAGPAIGGMNDRSYYGLHDASRQPTSAHAHAHPQHHLHNPQMALSPTTRALRAHEPGQSLPQGLAAGLSRLHLVPAANPISPPATGSPGMSASIMSNGGGNGGFANQQSAYGSWLASTSGGELTSPQFGALGPSPAGIASPPRFAPLNGGAFPGMVPRGVSGSGAPGSAGGRRGDAAAWGAHVTSSPLARPTIPDDDGLFDMDT
ncbi:hypothetical protein DL93DRAFT_1831198 [Clavulina sp. PMI_390]|nr:hypothetical protein DL93DRAFT_1831198 [Clavulina sp. PMI_390]